MNAWRNLSYPELAQKVLEGYLTDYRTEFLQQATENTYGDALAARQGGRSRSVTGCTRWKLWHGPTCAFKDYALQLMPKLLVEAKRNLGRKETTRILVATSGDTGKAALADMRGWMASKFRFSIPTARHQRDPAPADGDPDWGQCAGFMRWRAIR